MLFRVGILGVLLLSLGGVGAQVTNVLDWASFWRYYDHGQLPASDWMRPEYDDSQWPQRPGVFGFPEAERLDATNAFLYTPLSDTNNGIKNVTWYFRTHFTVPGDGTTTLTFSNLLDDGAVFYLDGEEVARPGMTNGPVEYSTPAFQQLENVLQSFAVSNVASGPHLLAVELHQGGTNSSDAIFGLKLMAGDMSTNSPPQAPVILRDVEDQTVFPGRNASFSVYATGTLPLSYRWFSNGVLRLSGSFSNYTTPAATLGMNGTRYHVEVTNSFGAVTSRVALLTVTPDTIGPMMTNAFARASNQVQITFNEALAQTSATNVNNYSLRQVGTTNRLVITNALFGVTLVRVSTATPLDPIDSQWVLVVNNLSDVNGNRIAPNSQIAVWRTNVFTNTCFVMTNVWHWNDSGVDLGAEWRQPDYVEDGTWKIGPAIFSNESPPGPSPGGPPPTPLAGTNSTYYFRTTFAGTNYGTTNINLQLSHMIDDGAVFYLNGIEIGRFNMPSVPVDYETYAYRNIEPTLVSTNFMVTNLINGTNLFAVEIHRAGFDTTGDATFGLALSSVAVVARAPLIPTLQITRQSPNLVLTWDGAGYRLESASAPDGPWSNVPTAGNSFTTSAIGSPRFFRLQNP